MSLLSIWFHKKFNQIFKMTNFKRISLVCTYILIMQIQATLTTDSSTRKPEFGEVLPNITVAVGRDATLPCVVRHLQDYKVAFIHIDRQMILTIHNHVITRIPRFSITHDKHLTWSLHIKDVQKEDKGFYMCQVNTDPMVSTVGYLDVVVPPNIIDAESSPSTVSVRENHNATLICKAEGTPQPTITWRREDSEKIVLKKKKKEEKQQVNGEVLDLIRISRTEMGAYLCIAQNGVPPSISKRIILTVEFSPMIWIPNQLVGAPVGASVKLECHTESSPRAIAYWVFNDAMVLGTPRHQASEQHHSSYKLDSSLVIKHLTKSDFGSYKCISKNSLGETEGTIMLYEMERPTDPPQNPDSLAPVSVYGEDYNFEDLKNEETRESYEVKKSANEEKVKIIQTNPEWSDTVENNLGKKASRTDTQYAEKPENSHNIWNRSASSRPLPLNVSCLLTAFQILFRCFNK